MAFKSYIIEQREHGIAVTTTSLISGNANTMELPVTLEQFVEWRDGDALIQDAMRSLTVEQREFLLTGMTPEEQEEFFDE